MRKGSVAIAEQRSNEEVRPEEGKVWFLRRRLPTLLYLVCERNIIPVILPEGRTQPIYFIGSLRSRVETERQTERWMMAA